jgi:hypothetical protein
MLSADAGRLNLDRSNDHTETIMPAITNPMDGLVSLQGALRNGDVQFQRCELHPDLRVLLDSPTGEFRLTYALVTDNRVQATVVFAQAEPIGGVPCFGIGYAVAEQFRGNGLATSTVRKAIEELRHGLSRTGARRYYIEAIVATTN